MLFFFYRKCLIFFYFSVYIFAVNKITPKTTSCKIHFVLVSARGLTRHYIIFNWILLDNLNNEAILIKESEDMTI